MDPPGDAEVGATEQRVPAIAFPKSDRLAAPVAGDGYGDIPTFAIQLSAHGSALSRRLQASTKVVGANA